MHPKISNIIIATVIVILVILGLYFILKKPALTTSSLPVTTTTTSTSGTTATSTIVYTNTQYGFSFTLPLSWTGYSIITTAWQGNSLDANGQNEQTVTGPEISIRNPSWTATIPTQDIPIMVFTTAQWNALQADQFHIGAAPIGPSELGQNTTYVFAIPARYNFAFPADFQEVEQIIQGNNFQAF